MKKKTVKEVTKKTTKRGRPFGSTNKAKKPAELGQENLVSLAIRVVDICNSHNTLVSDINNMNVTLKNICTDFCSINNQNAKTVAKLLGRVEELEKMVTDLKVQLETKTPSEEAVQ